VSAVEHLLGRGAGDDHPALIDVRPAPHGAVTVTYGDLTRLVAAAAKQLRASGVVARTGGVPRIGIAAPNGVPHVVLALAVLEAGGCVVPVASELAAPEQRTLLAALRPRAVLLADDARGHFGGLAGWPEVAALDVVGTRVRALAAGEGASGEPASFDEELLEALDPAFIRFSSGTTGASKGVILSHATLRERVAAANRGLGIGEDDRVLWLMPMAHHFAASIVLYLAHRATTVLVGSTLATDVLAAARAHRTTVFYGSPFHHAVLAADPGDAAWPSLRLSVSTAAVLPVATARAFDARWGVPVAQALGIIEAGLVAVNDQPRARPDSVGRPLPDFAAVLGDEAGRPVATGVVGELRVRGPGLLDGYLWPFRPRAEILDDGWFATGDLATADADGSLRLVGRARSVINVSGLKCFPEEIEAVLQQHPDVAAARVSGRAHPRVGAVPVADVVARDAHRPPAVRELAAHCRAALARYKVPVDFRIVDALPRTASGKVKR
jgi:long-chain acyl-CoA synthetase